MTVLGPRSEGDEGSGGLDGNGDGDPEFGPRGYLPERAAYRARKIVLREPMGLQWPLAALVMAVVLAAAGVAYFWWQARPPQEPYMAAAEVAELESGAAQAVTVGGETVLVVRAGGRLQAFLGPHEAVVWCAETGRLESPAGDVWTLEGRRTGGQASSLAPLPTRVHRGVVYVAPDEPRRPLPPTEEETPACTAGGPHNGSPAPAGTLGRQ